MADSVFDVGTFAAKSIRIRLHGSEYELPADPDVDVLANLLRIETAIKTGRDEDVPPALVEGKAVLLGLLRDANPGRDLDDVRVGVGELLTIFALISDGPSVAEAVARGIMDAAALGDDELRRRLDEAEGESRDPLASARPSSEHSSPSDDLTDGDPDTGEGSPGRSSVSTSPITSSV